MGNRGGTAAAVVRNFDPYLEYIDRYMEGRRVPLRVEMPTPRVTLVFDDERATGAVVYFLRDTKVGQVVALPPRGEGGGRGWGRRRRAL